MLSPSKQHHAAATTADEAQQDWATREQAQPAPQGKLGPDAFGSLVRVESVSYGKALVAARDLEPGTVVEQFRGPDVNYAELSDYDKAYALNYLAPDGEWRWLLPTSNARFANHSCDPNSVINEKFELETRRHVKKGEQITFIYNVGEDTDPWDPIWSFTCMCGAANCQGLIDRYRPLPRPPQDASLLTHPTAQV
ncbi:hypothetical protein HK105_206097 [Polyrhizophydium stewartii]|uniref:SET domain-containing protein n=1 Tax=Polyrhizophydium stewartii TaxID=2732419 RepID=A0ABR4N475_9FUNG